MPFRDPTAWMWAEACDMIDRAERLQRQFFQLGNTLTRRPVWEPPIDIVETRTVVRIVVALPGAAPEQVQVNAEETVITVSGERTSPFAAPDCNVHRAEIPYGHFERRIELGGRGLRLLGKRIENGCLLIELAKPNPSEQP